MSARALSVAVGIATSVAANVALAQSPVVVWTAGPTAATGRAELWGRRVARALEREGLAVSESTDLWAMRPTGAARERVDEIAEVERAMADARALAANLEEAAALVRLSAAEGRARDALDVPGAVAWYVELELELAALAHQLGELSLARACLGRAASLAPERQLFTAEAPPELVALHDVERAAHRTSPLASARIEASGVAGAAVYVDDAPAGAAPVRIEVRAGVHVIRIEAAGHLPWARLVDLSPGARPPIEVLLSPERSVAVAREARAWATRLELDRIPGALAALGDDGRAPRALVLVVAGAGVLDRALALVCDATACHAPIRLEGAAGARLELLEGERSIRSEAATSFTLWLDEALPLEVSVPPPAEWWTEWWPWAGLGVLCAGALATGLGVGFAEQPAPAVVFRVTVEGP